MAELNHFEKNILIQIDFIRRFQEINNMFTNNIDNKFILTKKVVIAELNKTGFVFEANKNNYILNEKDGNFNFRFLLEIKNKNCLSYIFVLRDEEFLNNGLSHFGYLLNSFDLSNLYFNQNFGINSEIEFQNYVERVLSIFHDFKFEYLKQVKH